MNEGHSGFFIARGNPELESFSAAVNDVGRACAKWLQARGLRSPGEIEAERVIARRREMNGRKGK